MAHYAAGVTASWRGTTLGEITELKVAYGGGLPTSRGPTPTGTTSEPWSLDLGTIDVSALSNAGLSISEWGRKGVLAFGGTAVNQTATSQVVTVGFSTKAICQSLQNLGKVQDVWRYQGTFKIVKE
jgi:hypothetical protein